MGSCRSSLGHLECAFSLLEAAFISLEVLHLDGRACSDAVGCLFALRCTLDGF